MKDIQVTCDCGKPMCKVEDGRESSRWNWVRVYPYRMMEFVCEECYKAVAVSWDENDLVLSDTGMEEPQKGGT